MTGLPFFLTPQKILQLIKFDFALKVQKGDNLQNLSQKRDALCHFLNQKSSVRDGTHSATFLTKILH